MGESEIENLLKRVDFRNVHGSAAIESSTLAIKADNASTFAQLVQSTGGASCAHSVSLSRCLLDVEFEDAREETELMTGCLYDGSEKC